MFHSSFSRLIAGTMNWGAWGKNLSSKAMADLISCCVSNGITTFDHADIYGGYTTEAAFGSAFPLTGLDRSKVQLITKCGIQYPCDSRPLKVKYYDYTSSYIIESVAQSLKNLNTDYLDLLLLHRPSPLMQPEEIAKTVISLQESGKIKSFGVSNFNCNQTALLDKFIEISANQIQFSITHLDPLTDGSFDYMMQNDIIPMAWNPLGNVFLESGVQNNRILAALEELSDSYNTTPEILLLSWILHHPAKIHPVFGTTNPKRIDSLPKALKIIWKTEDWFYLWVASRGVKVP
jgi:predicted oxidoreductase